MSSLEYYRAYNAAHREKKKAQYKEWLSTHKEERSAYMKAYNSGRKEKHVQHVADHNARHPERYAARHMVNREVEAGRFPAANTMVCDICGEALAAHWHHHNGYGPGHEIDVIAVCIKCHADEHRKHKPSNPTQRMTAVAGVVDVSTS